MKRMIKDVIESIGAAARKMFANWGALLISFALYLALLGVLYLFFTMREATSLQVWLSFLVLPLLAILLFLVLQAMAVSYVRIGVGPGYLLRRALEDSWKLLLISLPLLLIAGLIIFGVWKIETSLTAQLYNVSLPSGRWKLTGLNWARIFLLYFVLPLTAIHFWIAAVREGIGGAIKGFGRSLARAFAPRSVLIYLLVVAVCGVIAYLLFFTKTTAKSEWTELWLFGARLALALVVIFLGWLLTLGALAELTTRRALNELSS